MKCCVPILLAWLYPAALWSATPRDCIGSVPIATFQIRVSNGTAAAPLPLRLVNTVAKGYKIACTPVKLPADLRKSAKIALVVVPASAASGEGVIVLDPLGLDGPAEWQMPFQAGLILLVFGPQGLDEKRVSKLVSKDDDLIAELATYADQTEDLEDTIDALAAVEDSGEDADEDAVPARGAPGDQVLYALTRALNPVMAAYNPLGPGKRAGPATLKGKAADAFFDNAGGFVPGGGALPMVKTWLMPDTEFRTVYTEPAAQDGLTLCGQRKSGSHRFVYLWAHRAVNSGPPNISLPQPAWMPIGARSSAAVKVKSVDEWPLVDRVREWTLVGGSAPVPVRVRSDQRRSIELDLRKTPLQPGTYRLQGKWDWGTAQVAGEFHLALLADTSAVHLAEGVQGRLVEASGLVPVQLEGTDFQFVERVSLRRAGRFGGTPTELDYALPVAPRAGPQQALEVEIDTNRFHAGGYLLALAQTGGSSQNVPVKVLPPLPRIDNLPLRVGMGAKDLRLVLRGSGLERIEAITAEHATVRLGAPGGDEREVFVSLDASANKGDRLPLQLAVDGVADAGRIPGGIVVAPPRPRVAGIAVSPPEELGGWLRKGELPAGSFVSLSIRAENVDAQPALELDCAEAARTLQPLRVRPGEKLPAAKLDVLGDGTLFASLDPGAVGVPGCTLQAALSTEAAGASEPQAAGRVVRLPRIDSVTLTDEKVDQGYAAVLEGWDLETIEKTGWDAANGLAVPSPPRNVAGAGARETLRIAVPWPSPTPAAPLFVWLRGDTVGRPAPRSHPLP
jgi:hypothetical protein